MDRDRVLRQQVERRLRYERRLEYLRQFEFDRNRNMATFTEEQLETLLSRITSSIMNSTINATTTSPVVEGSFLKCTLTFSGNSDENVDTFIDAIETYKSCGSITDEIAWKGLPMLLKGNAALWFQGVKPYFKE